MLVVWQQIRTEIFEQMRVESRKYGEYSKPVLELFSMQCKCGNKVWKLNRVEMSEKQKRRTEYVQRRIGSNGIDGFQVGTITKEDGTVKVRLFNGNGYKTVLFDTPT